MIQNVMPQFRGSVFRYPARLVFAVCLTDNGLEYAAGTAEIFQITGFGAPGYLVQPADRRRFETGF
jgi:hypothetical protein